ncbi:MAG: TlyA family RNA methyltransferase [Erysipelotrichaceae bacterium]|nr:TlyA family RNA methyltransferase [Erysipelotrichaceae bacterium]
MSRLDVYLTEKGYFSTRSRAQQAIREGLVRVNGRIVTKTGTEISDEDRIEYLAPENQFVSRGGYKLLEALEKNDIELDGLTVLDIGSSSGGFTDCCLQKGARKVYAYDVGHDQLDEKLRKDPRVVSKEGINCRNLTAEDFDEPIDFICMDVSFISCTRMLKAISDILSSGKKAVVLFKPQFEVGSRYLNRHGVVRDDRIIKEKIEETVKVISDNGLQVISVTDSPIRGGEGNREYLICMKKI